MKRSRRRADAEVAGPGGSASAGPSIRVAWLIVFSLLTVTPLVRVPQTRLVGQQPASSSDTGVGTVPVTTHVLGLENIKRNAKGRLVIKEGSLEFDAGTTKAEVSIASIQDVFTGQDSKQMGGTTGTVAKLALPYGTGRAVSLFASHKIDVLTLEYRDSDGGLHGVIFTLPAGQAPAVKTRLVELGAHASVPPQEPAKP